LIGLIFYILDKLMLLFVTTVVLFTEQTTVG